MNQNVTTAQRMRRVRAYLKITQEELAELLDVHPQTISKIERGLPVPLSKRNSNLLPRFEGAPIPEHGVSKLISERGGTTAMLSLLANETAFAQAKRRCE